MKKNIIRPHINGGKLKSRKIIGQYRNGNYYVYIMDDGTKIRFTEDDEFKPSFPENIDLCITKSCSIGCQFCYANCVPKGQHWDYENGKIKQILNSLRPYTELAINGNDFYNIPYLDRFLSDMKRKNVFVNATFHFKQYLSNFERIKLCQTSNLLHGIGISINEVYSDQELLTLNKIKNGVIHVVAGIFNEKIYNSLKNKFHKILILGYKHTGRGILYDNLYPETVKKNIEWLEQNILSVMRGFTVCSFDNLALEQLRIKEKVSPEKWQRLYMGDDGGFTMYIDAVEEKCAKNSIEIAEPYHQFLYKYFDNDNELTIENLFNKVKTRKC